MIAVEIECPICFHTRMWTKREKGQSMQALQKICVPTDFKCEECGSIINQGAVRMTEIDLSDERARELGLVIQEKTQVSIPATLEAIRDSLHTLLIVAMEADAEPHALRQMIDAKVKLEMAHLYMTDRSYKGSAHQEN